MVPATGMFDDGCMTDLNNDQTSDLPSEEIPQTPDSADGESTDRASEPEPQTTTEPQTAAEPAARPAGRWTRPRQSRILAGVAAGVANATGLPLWFVRTFFAVSTAFGGFGLIAYLAAWALMPEEGEQTAAVDEMMGRFNSADSPSKKAGLALIGIGALLAISATNLLSSPLVLAALLVGAGIYLTRPSTT